MEPELQLKQEMVRICRMLHQKNLIAASDGNVSLRCGDFLLCTPSGINKGFMEADDVITVDLEGRLVSGRGRPTSEMQMHLLAYRLRPEVGAVIHAHPPLATACSIAGVSLEEPVLPEVVVTLRKIPTAAYATPTTAQLSEAIRELLKDYDAIILARHGAMTVGRDLMEAYNKMEKLEHTALVVLTARLLGGVSALPPEKVEKLRGLAAEHKGGG
jgi:L-fuculose-phosphate aldolase